MRRLLHVARVLLARVVAEDAAEDLRVERLHPAAEDLGESGRLLDERDRDAGLLQVRGRAAGRDELDAALRERARELGDARSCRGRRRARRRTGTHGRSASVIARGNIAARQSTRRCQNSFRICALIVKPFTPVADDGVADLAADARVRPTVR